MKSPDQKRVISDANFVLTRLGFETERAKSIVATIRNAFDIIQPAHPLETDRFYLANLRRLASPHSGRIAMNEATNIETVGKDQDFLAQNPRAFTFLKTLNWAAMASEPSRQTCALIATVRNEGPFLLEWIAHNRAIGFDAIILYTNENGDGSNALLERLARNGLITLVYNEAGTDTNPQVKAYEHALLLQPTLRRHRWWMTLDADEFLIIDERYDHNIQTFVDALESGPIEAPECVCFNWFWMGSHGEVSRRPGFVTDRFPYGSAAVPFVKSLFRPSSALSLEGVHKPTLVRNSRIVNSALLPRLQTGHDMPFDFSGGRINHYWNKSFQEFLVKQSRGQERAVWQRNTELFFEWDIAPSQEVPAAPSPVLQSRMRRELGTMLAIPDIEKIQNQVEQSYNTLSTSLCSEETLQTRYRQAQARVRILKRLRAQAKASPDPSRTARDLKADLLDRLARHWSTRR